MPRIRYYEFECKGVHYLGNMEIVFDGYVDTRYGETPIRIYKCKHCGHEIATIVEVEE